MVLIRDIAKYRNKIELQIYWAIRNSCYFGNILQPRLHNWGIGIIKLPGMGLYLLHNALIKNGHIGI